MARIYPLFSSSKGNSTYIGNKDEGILIDDGVSFSKLKTALDANGISADAIKAVFVTHEHSDHIKGLEVLTKKIKVPLFSRRGTLEYLQKKNCISCECFDISDGVEVCGMCVTSFPTSHDAAESCGYKILFRDGKTAAVCTDLGYVSDEVETAVIGTDCVLLEANYDVEMLRSGIYPYYLKARIFGKQGHLSNPDSGAFAAKLVRSGTTRLILGHLSQENNTPAIAEKTVSACLNGFERNSDYLLYTAPVETQGGFIAL